MPSRGLGPWVLGPLALLVVLVFAMGLLPPDDCEGTEEWLDGPGRIAFGAVALAAFVAVAAAGILRLVQMYRWGLSREADRWLLGGALLLLAVATGIGGREGQGEEALAGLLVGGLLLAVSSLLALIVAAFRGGTVDEVGALAPICLLGFGMGYLLFAWVVLDLNAHPLC
jgi:hypothetical protein